MQFNEGDEVEVVVTAHDLLHQGLDLSSFIAFPDYIYENGTATFSAIAIRKSEVYLNLSTVLVRIVNPRNCRVYWLPEHCVSVKVNTPQRRALRMFKEKYNAARV
jgi:hypothetical protein